MSLASDLRVLWKASGFRKLTYTRLISQGGDGMFQVGIATAFFFDPTHATTGRDIAIGFATLLAPFTIVGPFVGPLIDRWQRQRILIVGNLIRLVMVAGILACLLLDGPLWVLYVLALGALSVNRFHLAAMTAGIPKVVPPSELLAANSVLPTLGTIAAAVGAAVAGVTSFVAPTASDTSLAMPALVCAGLAFGLASWAATRIGHYELGPENPLERLDFGRQVRALWSELSEGFIYLRVRVTPLHALGVMAAQRLLYGILFVAAILMSRNLWGDSEGGADALANFTIVLGFAAVGFFLAAVLTPAFGDRIDRHRWVVLCVIIGAGGQALLALSTAPWALLSAAVVVSFAVQGGKIAVDTIIQRDTEDEVRGRAFTLYDMAYNVAFMTAAVVGALILPDSGYSRTVMVSLVGVYLLVAFVYSRAPRVARPAPATASAP
jgi:MFS family permease